MRNVSILLIVLYGFLNPLTVEGQYIRGKILDESEGNSIGNQELSINGDAYTSDPSGKFEIENIYKTPNLTILIKRKDYKDYELQFPNDNSKDMELGILFLQSTALSFNQDSEILSADDLEIFDDQDAVSSLLSAAWDPFSSQANFNFRVTRFTPRGLGTDHQKIYLNGLQFNNLENGRYFWSLWGGLNDVLRNQYNEQGLNSSDFGVGGFAGLGNIDLRATNMREGTRFSTNVSNRSYQYRTMLTHSSGPQQNGWAYTLSASRRWGSSGFIDGTYYDGYSYFVSVDKVLNSRHTLNATILAAPTVRGRSTASTQFVYDLVGDNFYNPNWGYQNGKVRNSREYRTHQPVATLRHDFKLNDNTKISSAVGFQTGKFGSTRLGWLDAADPRPDYYGNLPYDNREILSEADLASLTAQFQNGDVQLDWDEFYAINRARQYPVLGEDGEFRDENISAYIVEEQRFDNDKIVLNSNLVHTINDKYSFQSGIGLQYDRVHNYKIIDDLLGGSNFLDIDGFALRDSGDNSFIQNNIDEPNRLLDEGDVFGYDFTIHDQNINTWANFNISLPKVDFTISSRIDYSRFWRVSEIANGKFPEDSRGKSEVADFVHGTLKFSTTYKINGRNYIYGNIGYITRAPFSRNSFESPRTRDFLVAGLETEKIYGGELGYILRHPKLSARVTGYYFNSQDAINSTAFFFVNTDNTVASFVNLITKNIDKVNYGVEIGLDYKLTSTINLRFASNIGEYYFDSRPELLLTVDNSATNISDELQGISYLQNFNQRGTPKVASSFSIEYRSPKYWSISLTASYFRDIFIDANAVRRTPLLSTAVDDLTSSKGFEELSSEDLIADLVAQEKLDPVFTLDLFARKSFRIKGKYTLSLTASVSNLLDDRDLRTSGFEQLRFDYENLDPNRWATRYFYSFGRNFNVGAALNF